MPKTGAKRPLTNGGGVLDLACEVWVLILPTPPGVGSAWLRAFYLRMDFRDITGTSPVEAFELTSNPPLGGIAFPQQIDELSAGLLAAYLEESEEYTKIDAVLFAVSRPLPPITPRMS